ncbi:MAG: ribonuclease HII [Bacteroidales bacterium]
MKGGQLLSFYKQGLKEAGCDEAGRGCLAGPVVAAAVILPEGFKNNWINDSKLLNEKTRNKLRQIIENESLAWAVSFVDNNEIDRVNILNASLIAMNRAVQKLDILPQHLIIDGNRFKNLTGIPFTCIVKGDSKYLSIAAASILAKTHRDEYMLELHQQFPQYSWDKNKAYPTKDHKKAIQLYGITQYHRKSFHLDNLQLKLEIG